MTATRRALTSQVAAVLAGDLHAPIGRRWSLLLVTGEAVPIERPGYRDPGLASVVCPDGAGFHGQLGELFACLKEEAESRPIPVLCDLPLGDYPPSSPAEFVGRYPYTHPYPQEVYGPHS